MTEPGAPLNDVAIPRPLIFIGSQWYGLALAARTTDDLIAMRFSSVIRSRPFLDRSIDSALTLRSFSLLSRPGQVGNAPNVTVLSFMVAHASFPSPPDVLAIYGVWKMSMLMVSRLCAA